MGPVAFDSPIVDVDENGQVSPAYWAEGEILRSGPIEISARLVAEQVLGGMDRRSRSSVWPLPPT